MSYNPDLNNERFFNYVHEIANQVQQDHKGISVQCLSTLESINPFMFRINDEEAYYPIYQHIGMESTAQETLYNIRKTLEVTIELYQQTKHILRFMQQAYPEVKEPTVLIAYVDDEKKRWNYTPAFAFDVISHYHNYVSLILTADKLNASVKTVLPQEGMSDVVMKSESTILTQDIHQPSDIKDLAINVLMKDATYQFRKHFGIEGVDY